MLPTQQLNKLRQLLLDSIPQLLTGAELTHALAQHPELQVNESAANFIYVCLQNTDCKEVSDRLSDLNQQLLASSGLRITVGSRKENLRMFKRLQATLVAQAGDI